MKKFLPALLQSLLLPALAVAQLPNVGINITTPTQTLDVNGSLRVRGLSGTDQRLPLVQPDGTLGVNPPTYTTEAGSFPAAAAGSVYHGITSPTGVALRGTQAYLVGLASPQLGYNISSPAAPVFNCNLNTNVTYDVKIVGNMTYTVGGSLRVWDTSNPAAPVMRGSIASTGATMRSLAVSGTTAYVVTSSPAELQVYDVSTPTAPALQSSVGLGSGSQAFGVEVSGTTVYIADFGASALLAYNVSSPTSPVLQGSISTGAGGQPYSVAVSGTTAYVANSGLNELRLYDVSDPANMTLLSVAGTRNGPRDVAIQGLTAYVATFAGTSLQVFDVSVPAAPRLHGTILTSSSAQTLAVSGSTVCVGVSNRLEVFTIPPISRTMAVLQDGSLASVPTPTLALNGQSLSLTGINAVTLPATVAGSGLTGSTSGTTTTLRLGGTALSTTTDLPQAGYNLTFSGSGNVGVGTTAPLGRLTLAGGSLLVYPGLNNASTRPAVGAARLAGEIAALGQAAGTTPSLTADDGFLRLSAGGGTSASTRSYLDLSGYSLDNGAGGMYQNIVLGTSGTERLRVTANGNVGIGTNDPGVKLDVVGTIRGTSISPSDRRLKEAVRPLGSTLAQVQALAGARYRWNTLGVQRGGEAGQEQIGLIAQEVERIFPELVNTDAQGYKSVNYAQLTPVLIEAIKEQQQQIEALQAGKAATTATLESLAERLRVLEACIQQARR